MGDFVGDLIRSTGYFGILILMVVENIFPPIPSEVIMPFGGFLISKGELTWIGVILSGTIGTVIGALPFYWVGYKLGPEKLKTFCDRHGRWVGVSRSDVDKAQQWFGRHGRGTVFFLRLVPGLRTLISVPAGFSCMPFLPFMAFTTAGSLLWCSFLTGAGYVLGSQFEQAEKYIGPVSTTVIGALLLLYLYRVVTWKSQCT